jgi:hypothetical protein
MINPPKLETIKLPTKEDLFKTVYTILLVPRSTHILTLMGNSQKVMRQKDLV